MQCMSVTATSVPSRRYSEHSHTFESFEFDENDGEYGTFTHGCCVRHPNVLAFNTWHPEECADSPQ